MPVSRGQMHGSIWWMVSCDRLIDLICARSPGVMGPLSLLSFRRTSFSIAALSPKSIVAGGALQAAASFFTNAGAGAAASTGMGAGVGVGVGAGAAASGADGAALGSSH